MTDEVMSILESARNGDISGIVKALDEGADIDTRDPESDRTPLMEAVASAEASVAVVRLLLQRGANVNAFAGRRKSELTNEQLDGIEAFIENRADSTSEMSKLSEMKNILETMREADTPEDSKPIHEIPLSLAVNGGNQDKIETLLDAGADIKYLRSHGYDVLIDAMGGRNIVHDSQLLSILRLLIARGANLNGVSSYSESALSIASNYGRFDAVQILLAAGANPAPLQWTPLMHAVALGSLGEVGAQLNKGADLTARDFWSRTPWLLSLQTGEVQKAQLLLDAGAARFDCGRCGKVPLMYPIINGDTEMLSWLLSVGCDPNDTDEFKSTPLMEAAENGATECVQLLIDAGADLHRVKHGEPAIKLASNLEIVRILVNNGADLNEISREMRASLTHLPFGGKLNVSRSDYLAARTRRFGQSNPEKMNLPFWRATVASGANAYTARKHFDDTDDCDEPVWCFQRFGKSINELPDGRIIEIAGEHEDHYDRDFCIYNDVIVHHGNGVFDIYGYPEACFPPTDFHTATLVGKHIYIIGSLGYQGKRKYGETQTYRLDTESYTIETVATSGELPGWISRHKATLTVDGNIRIFGGKVCVVAKGKEEYQDNSNEFVLDLNSLVWRRAT